MREQGSRVIGARPFAESKTKGDSRCHYSAHLMAKLASGGGAVMANESKGRVNIHRRSLAYLHTSSHGAAAQKQPR